MNGQILFQRALTAAFCLLLASPVLGEDPTIWYVVAPEKGSTGRCFQVGIALWGMYTLQGNHG